MPLVELTEEQVIAMVRQLPPERKQAVLIALAADSTARRDERMALAEAGLRKACAQRGRDWDCMTEDEREAFTDDLIHEDRACGL